MTRQPLTDRQQAVLDPKQSTTLARKVLVDGRYEVEIPAGYKLAKGVVQPGDKYLSRLRLPEIFFEPVQFPLRGKLYSYVGCYSLLIRLVGNGAECPCCGQQVTN